MAIRSGMQNLVDRLRQMTNVGTAQYTAGTTTYWTDDHLQDSLDRHNTWVVDDELVWQAQNIGGTAQYFTALSRYRDFEEAESGTSRWQIRETDGTSEGTANYSVDYENGRVTWSANQGGTVSYVVTGYSYDLYAAAIEVLEHKLAYVHLWYDFSAGDGRYDRSQIRENIESQIARYRYRQGDNLPSKRGDISFVPVVRTDINW